MGIHISRLCAGAAFLATAAFAQTPAAPLTFEVASVKPSGPLNPAAIMQGKMRIGMKVDGAMVDIGSFSIKDLIRTAYEVKDYQISGPEWMNSPMNVERFNIQAKLPEGATEKQAPEMLRALLADRFKLVVHHETKDHSVYALVVAKGGPKLKESDPETPGEPATDAPKPNETVFGQGSSQVRITGNPNSGRGMVVNGGPGGQMRMSMEGGRMHMEAEKMSMPALAEFATRFVDRPVVDMTELKGTYKVSLDLSMEDLQNIARSAGVGMMEGRGGGGRGPSDAASDPSGSSIFLSLQQMGLKLEARKAPVDTIVIDHVEKTPTEN